MKSEFNTTHKDNFATIGVLGWFILLMVGPYLPLGKLPLRLDHFIFPIIGTGLFLYLSLRNKKIEIPKVSLPYLGFLLTAFVATGIAIVSNSGFWIKPIPFLAALDNHLRVILIFLLVPLLPITDLKTIIKWSIIIGAFLCIWGYFQVSETPLFIHDWVEKTSIKWYSGRSDRGISMVKILMHLRAVSTFYLPGNFALFCSLMFCFLAVCKKQLKMHPLIYYFLIFTFILGLFFSRSKGFFVATGFFTIYSICSKNWKLFLAIVLSLGLSVALASKFTRCTVAGYAAYFKHKDIISFYNTVLGPRFGEFFSQKEYDEMVEREKIHEERIRKKREGEIKKSSVAEKEIIERQESSSEEKHDEVKLQENVETTEIPSAVKLKFIVEDEKTSGTKETKNLFVFDKGNLSGAIKVVGKHKWLGVGYVSNVDYGDSMLVHLLVRGGVIGILFYFSFLFYLNYGIYKKYHGKSNYEFALAWIFASVLFLIGGIAYPSFVQDRSGDLYWWIGAILATGKVKYE